MHLQGPSALDKSSLSIPEMHCVQTILPGASPLTDTGQEDGEVGQSVGICQPPLFCSKKWSWELSPEAYFFPLTEDLVLYTHKVVHNHP